MLLRLQRVVGINRNDLIYCTPLYNVEFRMNNLSKSNHVVHRDRVVKGRVIKGAIHSRM